MDYILLIVQFEENILLMSRLLIGAYKRSSRREGSLSCHSLGHGTSVYTVSSEGLSRGVSRGVTSYDKPGLLIDQDYF